MDGPEYPKFKPGIISIDALAEKLARDPTSPLLLRIYGAETTPNGLTGVDIISTGIRTRLVPLVNASVQPLMPVVFQPDKPPHLEDIRERIVLYPKGTGFDMGVAFFQNPSLEDAAEFPDYLELAVAEAVRFLCLEPARNLRLSADISGLFYSAERATREYRAGHPNERKFIDLRAVIEEIITGRPSHISADSVRNAYSPIIEKLPKLLPYLYPYFDQLFRLGETIPLLGYGRGSGDFTYYDYDPRQPPRFTSAGSGEPCSQLYLVPNGLVISGKSRFTEALDFVRVNADGQLRADNGSRVLVKKDIQHLIVDQIEF